jgi:hypothetical protein
MDWDALRSEAHLAAFASAVISTLCPLVVRGGQVFASNWPLANQARTSPGFGIPAPHASPPGLALQSSASWSTTL